MKISRSFIVTVAALIIAALFLRSRIDGINNSLMVTGSDGASLYLATRKYHPGATNSRAPWQPLPILPYSNQPPHNLGL
jgi:hypothetical protein